MRALAVVLFASQLASALDNAKRFTNQTEGSATQVVSMLRWLARGEFPAYARPYVSVNGGARVAATEWQNDVITRWRDGSRARTITGVKTGAPVWAMSTDITSIVCARFLATGNSNDRGSRCTVNFVAAHGLRVGDRLQIAGATVDAALNRDSFAVVSVPTSASITFRAYHTSSSLVNRTYTESTIRLYWILDVRAKNHCWITSANHGFLPDDVVSISGVVGIVGANGTRRVTAIAENHFLVNTTCTGAYTAGGTATGSDFGSIQQVTVAVPVTLAQNEYADIDLAPHAQPCSLGNLATCRAAGLDQAGMLAFNGGSWDAQMEFAAPVFTGSTATITRNARTMLTAWDGAESYCQPRYWRRGPLVTELMLEKRCESDSAWDLGWKIVPGMQLSAAVTTGDTVFPVIANTAEVGTKLWMFQSNAVEIATVTEVNGLNLTVSRAQEGTVAAAYATGKYFGLLQYTDAPDDGFKSIHPWFVLTFNVGYASVKVQSYADTATTNRRQTMWYAPTIKTGAALTTKFTTPKILKHPPGTIWGKTYWSGVNREFACLGGGGTDPDDCGGTGGGTRGPQFLARMNTNYAIYSGEIPPYKAVTNPNVIDWWDNSIYHTGFSTSDRGEVGVARHPAYWIGAKEPYAVYLGDGTWGTSKSYTTRAEKCFDCNDIQEGGMFPAVMTQWLYTQDVYGLDILLGTSVPGGGGNSAVQGHIPVHWREDRPSMGAYVAGWDDSPFGRPLSTHTRPHLGTGKDTSYGVTANYTFEDKPMTSCWTASSVQYQAPPQTSLSKTIWETWPCQPQSTTGNDQWQYEIAHMNNWAQAAWMATGDERWVRELQYLAAFSMGHAHSFPGRFWGKIWGSSTNSGATRLGAFGNANAVLALRNTPTEPMFGEGGPQIEYWLMAAWVLDNAVFQEGIHQTTNGLAARLYPYSFTSSCTGWVSNSPALEISGDRYLHGRCGWGEQQPNPLHWHFSQLTTGACAQSSYPQIDCSKTKWYLNIGMMGYDALAYRTLNLGGYSWFDATLRDYGQWLAGMLTSSSGNGLLTTAYNVPGSLLPNGSPPSTYQQWKEAWFSTWWNRSTWIGGTGADGYVARMAFGATLADPDAADRTNAGCTAATNRANGCSHGAAMQFLQSQIPYSAWNSQYNKWAVDPIWRISNVRTYVTSGALTVRLVAPTATPCTINVSSSAHVSSYDTGDATMTAKSREQTYAWTGAAGTKYVRATCGKSRAYSTVVVP